MQSPRARPAVEEAVEKRTPFFGRMGEIYASPYGVSIPKGW
jgi:hypothetical protein